LRVAERAGVLAQARTLMVVAAHEILIWSDYI